MSLTARHRLLVALILLTSTLGIGQGLEAAESDRHTLVVSSHEDGQIVSERAVRLEGTTSLGSGIDVVVDVVRSDGSADRRIANRVGNTFSCFLVLSSGENRVIVSASPQEGPALRTAMFLLYRHAADDEPTLSLESPVDGEIIDAPVIPVEGRVTGVQDGAVVRLALESSDSSHRQEATVRDGRFRVWFVVEDEQNDLTVSIGNVFERISFRSTAPRRGAVHQEDRGQLPGHDAATPPSPEPGAIRPSVVVEPPPTRPVFRVRSPEDGALLTSPTLRVEGNVDVSVVSSVIVRTLTEFGRDERFARITGTTFSAWFVLRHPQVVVQVSALDENGLTVGDAVLHLRCSQPRGWDRPLPWENENAYDTLRPERSRVPTHGPGVAGGVAPRPPDDDQPDSSRSVDQVLDWRLLALPFLVVIGIPVGLRLIVLLRSLMQRALPTSRRTMPALCDFCGSGKARRHHLFDLRDEHEDDRRLMTELIEIAGLTSNEEVNERLRPLLERVMTMQVHDGTQRGIPVWCVWCRSCSSGFIVVGTGSGTNRHPILTPVFFDWLLVSLGLND